MKLCFVPEKIKNKYFCLPCLKFSNKLPKTQLFFILPHMLSFSISKVELVSSKLYMEASEYDLEIPQSYTADQRKAPGRRATEHLQTTE